MVSIVFLNGANPYDSNNEFTDLFDLPEAKFYMEIANNVKYKERRQKDIAADAAEVNFYIWSFQVMHIDTICILAYGYDNALHEGA